MSKLKFNWEALQGNYPQLRDYKAPCYIIECKNCKKLFRTIKIDYVLCKDCVARVSPKSSGDNVNTGSVGRVKK